MFSTMAANLTEALLRSVLQLPTRPYSDPFPYDGAPFQDLSAREPVQILQASGTASGAAYLFRSGTDFQVTAGAIDWTLPGAVKPDFGTVYTVDYTYSRLGSSAASTSMWMANIVVTQDLGSSYPYNTLTPQGMAYNDIATYAQMLVAAREATHALATSDIDTAEKYRRGTVLVDDTKKWEDWDAISKDYAAKYRAFLTLARPGGRPSNFTTVSAALSSLVLDSDFSSLPYNNLGGDSFDATNPFGGVL
ncbi:MAG: hypothetical protein ACYDBO_11050 [Vulcanimicrobiaceae bacterium]